MRRPRRSAARRRSTRTTSAGFDRCPAGPKDPPYASAAGVARVQPALALRLFFPPPATRALVLAGRDRPRARLASDRDEPALVKRVEGHVVLADVVPHLP